MNDEELEAYLRKHTLNGAIRELRYRWALLVHLVTRKLIARLLNPFYPGYGRCYRCQRNWCIAQAHVTNFTPDSGCFPLCEACWQDLTPEIRLPYYQQLWQDWNEHEEEDRQTLTLIEQAVRQGL